MSTPNNSADSPMQEKCGSAQKQKTPTNPTENRPFVLKKWNALAIWAWDVECDTCAICRVHLMDNLLGDSIGDRHSVDNMENLSDSESEESSSQFSFSDDDRDVDFEPEEKDFEYQSDDDEETEDSKTSIEYALVDFTVLLDALKFCRSCGSSCVDTTIEKPSDFCVSVSQVTLTCSNCRNTWKWHSSPQLDDKRGRQVNRDVGTALVITGLSYAKTRAFFQTLRTPFLQGTSHYNLVRNHIEPVVDRLYEETQTEVKNIVIVEAFNKGGIHLSGDAQYNSPGYCANFCRYAILDEHTKLVVETQLLRKQQKTDSSKALEPKALDVALKRVVKWVTEDKRTSILSITTDRDRSVSKMLSTKFPNISQMFDVWHFARNLKKALWKKMEQVKMKPARNWLKPLINHLYYSIESSGADKQERVEKFLSFFYHCQNIHHSFQQISGHNFMKVHKCAHGTLNTARTDYFDMNIPLQKTAYKTLLEISTGEKRLKDLEDVSPFFSTSEVESFNNVSTLYHPKELFHNESLSMRVKLSAIHWNWLKFEERRGERKPIGRKEYYNKTSKEWVWKQFKTPGTHKWRRRVLEKVRIHQ